MKSDPIVSISHLRYGFKKDQYGSAPCHGVVEVFKAFNIRLNPPPSDSLRMVAFRIGAIVGYVDQNPLLPEQIKHYNIM